MYNELVQSHRAFKGTRYDCEYRVWFSNCDIPRWC